MSKDYGSKVDNYTSAFESLATSCSKLRTELYGFVGVYYNDGLMRVLADLDFHLMVRFPLECRTEVSMYNLFDLVLY